MESWKTWRFLVEKVKRLYAYTCSQKCYSKENFSDISVLEGSSVSSFEDLFCAKLYLDSLQVYNF
jgi:hypothetical protein